MKKFFILFILFLVNSYSQVISSKDFLSFSQVTIPNKDTSSLFIINKFNYPVVFRCKYFSNNFLSSDTIFQINSKDSIKITITFLPNQNIEYNEIITYESIDSNYSIAIRLTGSAKYGDFYDATTFNKFDNELKSALTSLVSNHTSLGYNTARDRMFEIIDKLPGDTIECVYTGRKVKALTRTEAQNQSFNTEHTWPQGFFNENEPMKSDLNHLFPTDETANNKRANYPFGTVTYVTWEQGGSKLGTNKNGSIVFEPRLVHKGNVARSMLYFIIRYPQNYGNFLNADQEQNFRIWNKLDTVDLKEKTRNNYIQTYQGKRNPFIDHPELIDRIYSFINSNVTPKNPSLYLTQNKISFDSAKINDTITTGILLMNTGTSNLTISGVNSDNNVFEIQKYPQNVNPKSFDTLIIRFIPKEKKSYTGTININSNSGNISLPVSGYGKDASTKVFDNVALINNYDLLQNFPNPFNQLTKISFNMLKKGWVRLNIYDVKGNLVETLINEERNSGRNDIYWESKNYPSGVYFYELKTDNFRNTKKMLLLR